MLLTPALLCHKDTAQGNVAFCMPWGVLLWHRPWCQHSEVPPIRAQYIEDLDQWESSTLHCPLSNVKYSESQSQTTTDRLTGLFPNLFPLSVYSATSNLKRILLAEILHSLNRNWQPSRELMTETTSTKLPIYVHKSATRWCFCLLQWQTYGPFTMSTSLHTDLWPVTSDSDSWDLVLFLRSDDRETVHSE